MFLKRLHLPSFLDICVSKNKRHYFIQHRNFFSNACIFECTALTFSISFMSFPGHPNKVTVAQQFTNLSTSVSTLDLYALSRSRSKGWNLNPTCTAAVQFPSLSFCCWSALQNPPQWHFLNQQPNCLTYLLFDCGTKVPKQHMLDFTHISC